MAERQDLDAIVRGALNKLRIRESKFDDASPQFNPILMMVYMHQRYANATPSEKKFFAYEDCDDFEKVLDYMVAIFCKRGNNIDKIAAKSSDIIKNDLITLKKLFNIENTPKSDFTVTLARVTNTHGQRAINFYKVHNFQGPLPLSPIGATIPCAIRAPGFCSSVPRLSFNINDNQHFTIHKGDRLLLIKTSHILACLLDKLINSSKTQYKVDPKKVLHYVYISYELGLMDSSTRIKCLINNEIFIYPEDPQVRSLCLSQELSLILEKFCIENRTFTENVDYSKFNNDPKSDTMTLDEIKDAATKALKGRLSKVLDH